MKVRITFTEECLGTSSNNPAIQEEFISSKAPDAASIEEEVAAVGAAAVVEKGMTVFPRDKDGNPFLWNYQVKGFLKDACGLLSRAEGTLSGQLTAYKKVLDGLVFVHPRQIPVTLPEGGKIGNCQRPLRGQTAQGERISLANSETLPAGTSFEIDFKIYDLKEKEKKDKIDLKEIVKELLDYGQDRGLLQWRSSGKGTFIWEEIK